MFRRFMEEPERLTRQGEDVGGMWGSFVLRKRCGFNFVVE
jgi:hypothetical protein